jgi:hypothetical protein
VPHVKSDGRRIFRAGPDRFCRQGREERLNVVVRLDQRMRDWLEQPGNAGDRTL